MEEFVWRSGVTDFIVNFTDMFLFFCFLLIFVCLANLRRKNRRWCGDVDFGDKSSMVNSCY